MRCSFLCSEAPIGFRMFQWDMELVLMIQVGNNTRVDKLLGCLFLQGNRTRQGISCNHFLFQFEKRLNKLLVDMVSARIHKSLLILMIHHL